MLRITPRGLHLKAMGIAHGTVIGADDGMTIITTKKGRRKQNPPAYTYDQEKVN